MFEEAWRDYIGRVFCTHTGAKRISDFYVQCLDCELLIYKARPGMRLQYVKPKECFCSWFFGGAVRGVGGK